MKLTAQNVDRMQPTDRRQEIPDDLCTGLYLTVQPTGRKGWQVRYRHGGKHRRMTLGAYPILSLAAARQRAREILAQTAEGRDPAEEVRAAKAKAADPNRDKVASIIDLFMKRHASRNRRADDVAAMFQREIMGKWGKRNIQDIGKRDVIEVLDAIVDRGSPITANRLRAHLSTLFNWAKGRDIVQVNPVEGIPQPAPERPRDRYLADGEIPAFWAACEGLDYPFGPLYQLLLLTGQRLREVAELTWSEINGDLWTLPAARSKNADEHTIPLSGAALDILNRLPRTSKQFVFSTTGTSPISGFTRAKKRLDALMPEDTPAFTIHDLRRTATTGMASLRFPPHVVEAVLNHKSGMRSRVAGIYNQFDYADEKRQALEAWSRHVMRLVEGGGDNVVPMMGAR